MAASDAHDVPYRTLAEYPDSPSVYSPAHADDESASTMRSHLHYDSDLDDDASHRISLQGPRIRFHSRAPWETDDVFPHDEEPERSATVGSKLRGKVSRADTLMRTFTKGSFITGRPSIDSARSQASFEITAGNYSGSRGALYDLAKESMSTLSLASTASSVSLRQQRYARTSDHPEPSHGFTHTHGSSPLDGVHPPSMALESSAPSSSRTSRIDQEQELRSSMVSSSQERQPRDEFVHPYANPDLVVSYTPPEAVPSHRLFSGDTSGSDSNSTVADSTSVRSAAFSVISNETSTSSLTSRDHSYGNPRVNGKEISSPISVVHQSDAGYVDRNAKFLSLHPPPAGLDSPRWANLRSPAVTLITLQEAQARERVRSNTVHPIVARTKPDVCDISETTGNQAERMDTSTLARARARSTSAGTGMMHTSVPFPPAQISETGEDTVASTSTSSVTGRGLKHKKSGFLRLFAGRTSEGEKERSPPPSIPPIVDEYVKQSLQVHRLGKTSKTALPRVSKPSSSPCSPNVTTNAPPRGSDSPDVKGPSLRRRQPPSLSIITKAPDHSMSSSARGSLSTDLSFTPPTLTVPQSAPPGDTDFPGLKLRPVSNSFSSHFADMVAVTVDARQHDVYTPSSAASSSTALSPFTPVFMRRSDDVPATIAEAAEDEHLTVKALQGQFASAKKAWQQQIWELRGQIRDLTSELEDLRAAENQEYCNICGRGKPQSRRASPSDEQQPKKVGVVNRPRARTGDTARFASGN